jgi:hypothetical protein
MTTRNPYAPPRAAIETASGSTGGTPPNRDVERACKLFWASFAVRAIADVFAFFRVGDSTPWFSLAIGFLIGLAVAYLFTWWITSKLRAGRNWMRWFITILNIASIPAIVIFWDFFAPIYRDITQSVTAAIFGVLEVILDLAGLALLFTRTSREWFASQARA